MSKTYTNRYNLPSAVVDAIVNDSYNKGACDFSITELIAPARQRALRKVHEHSIEEDASDRLWSLYGQVAHTILERAGRTNANAKTEERFFMDIDGDIVSGQIDSLNLENGTLQDYKFTAAWSFTGSKAPKAEHIQQLNMQAYLLRSKGMEVNKLEIVALLRDWQLSKAKKDNKYPPPVVVQRLPMWTDAETLAFIKGRIYEHKRARLELPQCTSEETWGMRRCEDYCDVKAFCSQYQSTKKEEGVF